MYKIFFLFFSLFFILNVPCIFAGNPNPDSSTITAQTNIYADGGDSKSIVVVTIKDTAGVKCPNIQVILSTTRGDTDFIIQPSYTDVQGQCTGYVYSTAGNTTFVRAFDVTDGFYLTDSKPVYFIPVYSIPYFDNFDYGETGGTKTYFHDWQTGQQNMTELDKLWQHGQPVNGDDTIDNDFQGPTTAYSSPYLWATNLGGAYSSSNNDVYNQFMWLRSPNIDLRTSHRPVLTFQDWLDVEGANYDFVRLIIRNTKSQSEEYYLFDAYQTDHLWKTENFDIPSNFIGKIIYIQFQLHSDPAQQQAGWYVDNFYVREKADTFNSTLTSNKSSFNVDHNETVAITITIKDYYNKTIPRVPVYLVSSRGSSYDTITPSSSTTDTFGVCTFSLSSLKPGSITIYGYGDSNQIMTVLNLTAYSRKQQVIINEIAYAGDSTSNYQYLELYNTSDTTINLTNWKLGNSVDTITTAEFSGKSISSNSYFLIERAEITTDKPADLLSTNLKLRTNGDSIYLYDESNTVIDSALFPTGWTAGKAAIYASAEKITGSNNWDTANNIIFLNNNTQSAYGTPKGINTSGISDANSTLSCTLTTKTVGNTVALIVLIKNYDNNPVSNIYVSLSSDRLFFDTITQPAATNALGYCTGYLYSTKSGTSIISIKSPNNLTDTISIYWTSGGVSKTKSYFTYNSPVSINDTSTIYITYMDSFSNPVQNETAIIFATAGTVIQPQTNSDSNGHTTGYIYNTAAGTIYVYIRFSADTLTSSGTIVYAQLLMPPFIENFDSSTVFNYSNLWSDSSGGVAVVNSAVSPPSSPNALRLTNSGRVTSRQIDLSKYTQGDVQAEFYYEIGSAPNAPTISQEVPVEIYLTTGWYEVFRLLFFPYYDTFFAKRTITLPVEAFHSGFKIRFSTTDTATKYYYIDNIKIIALPSAQKTLLSSNSADTADNIDSCRVSVYVRDAANLPLAGETVTLYSSRGALDSIISNPVLSNSFGTSYFYVKSITAGTSVFTASIGSINVIDTAECYFRAGPVNADSSLISAQTNIVGNGKSQAKVTVQLRDKYGNFVPNKNVIIFSSDSSDTVIQPTAATNANGYAYGYVISSNTGVAIINAVDLTDSLALSNTAVINFIQSKLVINELMYNPKGVNPRDEWFEIYNASGNNLIYDTIYIKNSYDTIILKNFTINSDSYYVLAYTALGGGEKINVDTVYGTIATNFQLSNSGDTITIYDSQLVVIDQIYYTNQYSSVPRLDDHQGRTLERIDPSGSSTSSDNFEKSSIDSGTPGKINTVRVFGTAISSNDTIIFTGSSDSCIIDIYVKDIKNNPVQNIAVTLYSSRNYDTIIQPVYPSNAIGYCTGAIQSETSGISIISCTVPAGITSTLSIKVKNDVSQSTMYVQKHTTTNTNDSAVIIVNLKNSSDKNIVGETVAVATNRIAFDTIINNYSMTNSFGTSVIYLKSNKIGTSAITAILPEDYSNTVYVNVSAGTVSALSSTITSNHTSVANLSPELITVRLLDNFSNPVSGKKVMIFSSNSNDTITQPASFTDDSGYAYGNVIGANPGISYITASDTSDSISLNDSTYINFVNRKIVLNEIMFQPVSGDNGNSEWIELYNLSSDTVEISGWYIKNHSDSFIIPAGTFINPNSFYLLEYSEAATLIPANAIYGLTSPGLILANSSESLLLYDTSNTLIEYLQYSALWDAAAAGGGKSLERISPLYQTNISSNWRASSINGGTPKSLNTTLVRNTIFEIVKNNSYSNGQDSNIIKLTVKDVNNNLITSGLQLNVNSSRTGDTVIQPDISNSLGICYTYIKSSDSGNATISVDSPVGINNTAVITFLPAYKSNVSIIAPANNIYTNTCVIISGSATYTHYGDSVYLYQNDFLTNTSVIEAGDTYFKFSNIFPSDSIVNYYVKIINYYGMDSVSATRKIYYDTVAPPLPANINISGLRTQPDTTITINWTAVIVPDLVGYNIYRDTDMDNIYAKLNASIITDTNYYYDTIVKSGSEYIYVMTSVDSYSNESNYSDSLFVKDIYLDILLDTLAKYLPGDTVDITLKFRNQGFIRISNTDIIFNAPSNMTFDTVLSGNCSFQYSFISDTIWYDTPVSAAINKIKGVFTNIYLPVINLTDYNDSCIIRMRIK